MRKKRYSYLIIMISLVVSFIFYVKLGDEKIWLLSIMPTIMLISNVIFNILVKNTLLNGGNSENKLDLRIISNAMLMLLCIIHLVIVSIEFGYTVTFELVVGIATGIFIMILSNFMQRVEQNYIYGIRTPWTLKNKEVWRLTNRFSAKIFFITGLIIILFSILIPKFVILIMIGLVAIAALISVFSSYIYFRKIENKNIQS
ncbi:SdpI family protein [Bacillus thuringiensis]|uniref:SdpI family protein n=1 Tax=Bacillus thuringiensis TaxID=1428 RepID=UPI001EE06704|nr:SdpI family protein [Bacillus thuringiensis]MCG3426408.1 SdpI family protein [Bacillus thuringiensis]